MRATDGCAPLPPRTDKKESARKRPRREQKIQNGAIWKGVISQRGRKGKASKISVACDLGLGGEKRGSMAERKKGNVGRGAGEKGVSVREKKTTENDTKTSRRTTRNGSGAPLRQEPV